MRNENNAYPSVLIVAHEVINTTTSVGKTLYQYFNGWPTDKLSEIYFHSEVPTTHLCEQYFRITDFDVIKSLTPFYKPGTEYKREHIQDELPFARVDKGFQSFVYQQGMKKKDWMFLGRNCLWGLGTWKTKKLDEWIKRINPDVIFFPTSDYVFAYGIVEYLSKKYSLPVVVCVYDDYYFGQINKDTLLNRYNQRELKKHIKFVFDHAAFALYNQPKMRALYQQEFELSSDVFYVYADCSDQEERDDGKTVISYFGSLGLGRLESIIDIGRAIEDVDADGDTQIFIYSAEKNNDILKRMNSAARLSFQGSVPSQEVLRLVNNSSILLLPESFNPQYLGRIEYALSTKISEYLASNRCILAYGPKEAGTIGYLKDNGVGCVATNYDEMKAKLRELLVSTNKRKEYAAGQMLLAKQNHSYSRNHTALKNAFLSACKRKDY